VDTSDTTQAKLRPDLLVYIEEVNLLRGEEETSDFTKAHDHLKKKLHWNPVLLGDLPYLLGYAATQSHIQFFSLDKRFDT